MRYRLQLFSVVIVGLIASTSPARAQSQATPTGPTHEAGIFVASPAKAGGQDLVRIHGAMARQVKTQGVMKMALTQGISQGNLEAAITGETSLTRLSTASPNFVFYFDPNAGKADPSMDPMKAMAMMQNMGDQMPAQATSADDFVLIRLTKTDGARQGSVGGTRNSRKNKDAVDVVVTKLTPFSYTLEPKVPLTPGEYAFYFAGHSPGGGGILWDFGVDVGK